MSEEQDDVGEVARTRAALYREGYRVEALLFLEGTTNIATSGLPLFRDVLELGERKEWGYVAYYGPGPVVRRWKL